MPRRAVEILKEEVSEEGVQTFVILHFFVNLVALYGVCHRCWTMLQANKELLTTVTASSLFWYLNILFAFVQFHIRCQFSFRG